MNFREESAERAVVSVYNRLKIRGNLGAGSDIRLIHFEVFSHTIAVILIAVDSRAALVISVAAAGAIAGIFAVVWIGRIVAFIARRRVRRFSV